jgi:hypothetical protein
MAVRSHPAGAGRQLQEHLRHEIARRAEDLLVRKFRPLLEWEAEAREHQFNYPVAVFTEWRGQSFHFCVKYRTPSGRPEDEFVVRTTRLQHAGRGRFNLAYFRHTNRWQPVYFGLTVAECFEVIEAEELFWPLT